MDEPETNVVAEDANLANAGAHWSPALLKVVTETTAVLALSRIGGNAGDDIPDLEDDVPELRCDVLEVFFDKPFG